MSEALDSSFYDLNVVQNKIVFKNGLVPELNRFGTIIHQKSGTIIFANTPINGQQRNGTIQNSSGVYSLLLDFDLDLIIGITDSDSIQISYSFESQSTVDVSTLAKEAKQDSLNTAFGTKTDPEATSVTDWSLISLAKGILNTLKTSIKSVITGSGGDVSSKQLGTQLTNTDIGIVTNTIIHGQSTAGGGAFVDVKVTPSGAISMEGNIQSNGQNIATQATLSQIDTDLGQPNENAPLNDTATSGLNGRLQRIAQRLTTLINQAPTVWSVGTGNVDSGTQRVTLAADGATNTNLGATNETAPSSDTATSGLNGRLQRVAQRLTSIIALLPSTLGQKTKANSLAVTLASDSDTLPISNADLGLQADAVASSDTGTFSLIALFKRHLQYLGNVLQIRPASAMLINGIQYNSTTGLVNINIINNTTGWYDAQDFLGRIFVMTVVTGASTAGTIVFEQTDDITLDPNGSNWQLQDKTVITQSMGASQTLAASTTYRRIGVISSRYIRIRISVAISVGTVQGTFLMSHLPYSNIIASVNQATGSSLNVQATGSIADGSTSSGNGVRVVGVAQLANPTARTSGQIVAWLLDKIGRIVSVTNGVREMKDTNAMVTISTTAETTIVIAIASTFNDCEGFIISNTSAAATRVDIRETTAGAVRFSIPLAAGQTEKLIFTPTIAKQSVVNTNWTAQLSVAVTDVRITALTVRNV